MANKTVVVIGITALALVGVPALCVIGYLAVQIHALDSRPPAEVVNKGFDKNKFEKALKDLKGADRIFVYAIDPTAPATDKWIDAIKPGGALDPTSQSPRKSKSILGHTEIKDTKLKAEIISGAENSFDPQEAGALCFNPRHLLLAYTGDEKLVFVVSFECMQTLIYSNKDAPFMVGTGSQNIFKSASVSHLQILIDSALKKEGIKIDDET